MSKQNRKPKTKPVKKITAKKDATKRVALSNAASKNIATKRVFPVASTRATTRVPLKSAVERDLEELARLDSKVNLTPWDLAHYQSSFANHDHKIAVLKLTGRIIVAAIVVSVIDGEAEILQFWVRKEYLGQGYGAYVMSQILQKLRHVGVCRTFLEVRSNNKIAIELYEKFGFKEVGRRRNYYKVDGWIIDALTMLWEANDEE